MPLPTALQREFVRLADVGADLEGLVRQRPELLAAVVGALLVVVLLAAGVRRLLRPTGERFARVLAESDGVTVLTHPDPDPDALASALGVQLIAERRGTEAVIQYPGEIAHQENRAFETVLGLETDRVDYTADIEHEDVVLVDHSEPRGFSGAGRVEPLAIVDHHPEDPQARAFTDVRPDAGACASILTGYLQEVGWTPAEPDTEPHAEEIPSTVATGLAYGIQADTTNLTRGCTPLEFEAREFLMPGIDADLLDRIANPNVDREVLRVKARAIEHLEVRGAHAVSDVGHVDNPDAVPQAAEELLTMEGVEAVVVVGEHDGQLKLSGRSRDDRVHMGKALDAAVDGLDGNAGGHARMGGGRLPAAAVQQVGPGGVSESDLTERLFDVLGGRR